MILYRLNSYLERFIMLGLVNRNQTDTLLRVKDQGSLIETWPVVEVRLVGEDTHARLKARGMDVEGDCPYLGLAVVLTERACAALRPTIERYGELLPISVVSDRPYSQFFIFHVMHEIDALDTERAIGDYRPDGKKLECIKKYAFKPDVLGAAEVFRIPGSHPHFVFVTDNFVDRVKQAGLNGFLFSPVWSD